MTDPKIDAPRSESASPELRARYAVDGMVPGEVVLPESVEEVSRIMASASSEGRSVLPFGGGVLAGLGNLPRELDMVLSTSGLAGVIYHEPADLVASVQAGATVAELRSVLSKGGQALPLDAPFPDQATIGGIIAAGFSGPSRLSFGEPRDWLIGVKVVGADGRVSKAGGRVVKNVTGYDLNKLYTGALGTLGIIVEATFKVAPLQPESGALIGYFPSLEPAIEAGATLLNSPAAPMAYVASFPQPGRPIHRFTGMAAGIAFYSGRARATKRRAEETAAVLEQAGAADVSLLDGIQANELRQWLTNLAWDAEAPPALAVRIAAPRRSVTPLAAACLEIGGAELVADPGFGAMKLLWWDNPGDESLLANIRQARDAARAHGGSAVVEQAPASLKGVIDVWGEEPDSIGIMRRIKEQFDPAGLLNPGRFLGRL
jgi:glycolate oxidase FAD binding subunit